CVVRTTVPWTSRRYRCGSLAVVSPAAMVVQVGSDVDEAGQVSYAEVVDSHDPTHVSPHGAVHGGAGRGAGGLVQMGAGGVVRAGARVRAAQAGSVSVPAAMPGSMPPQVPTVVSVASGKAMPVVPVMAGVPSGVAAVVAVAGAYVGQEGELVS